MKVTLFRLDEDVKRRLNAKSKHAYFQQFEAVEADEITHAFLTAMQQEIESMEQEIQELNQYKQREIDAFAIGDAVSDGICMTDGKGVVLAINKVYTEITGITEEIIVGNPIQKLLDEGYFDRAVTYMVIEQKRRVSLFSTIASNRKKVLITGNPFINEAGEVTQVLTIMKDITELMITKEKLEKAERESERYRSELVKYKHLAERQSTLIGESLAVKKIKELISFVAKTDATVLITGETGTGKEVVAREIHENSGKPKAPYIKVNCAAIPGSLLESELFGYEKGAFTGALNKEKPGMFELADGGTLLLDEIGEMPMLLQSKLLRVLQEKEIMRVGGVKSVSVEVRVIASTNQNLLHLIEKGTFREDLYYRLNVIPVHIPPLRERLDDIPLLLYRLLEKYNTKYGKHKRVDTTAQMAMETYHWPGNIRELGNVIERLVVSDDDPVISGEQVMKVLEHHRDHQMKGTGWNQETITLDQAVEQVEKKWIQKALDDHGSTYKAAKALGTSQSTLFRKAKQLGVLMDKK